MPLRKPNIRLALPVGYLATRAPLKPSYHGAKAHFSTSVNFRNCRAGARLASFGLQEAIANPSAASGQDAAKIMQTSYTNHQFYSLGMMADEH